LIIDEGFGVLDAENLSTMQILFHFLKTNFDFIMVVSHLDALRDMVDNQMEIKKDNGFSKVYFVNSPHFG
jgi:DNA repair exonuclease SbcCD ATPase subunit